MDLKINALNFQGKKEVLYGLQKATQEVRLYSIGMQPRLQRLGENKNSQKHEAAAKAYLDMITNDDEFERCLWQLPIKRLRDIFKKDIEPIDENIKPLDYLSKFINEVMDKNRMFNHNKRNAGRGIIKLLSEL